MVTGTWLLFSLFYWGCHHPNWRTHIFQMGWNHQPVMRFLKFAAKTDSRSYMIIHGFLWNYCFPKSHEFRIDPRRKLIIYRPIRPQILVYIQSMYPMTVSPSTLAWWTWYLYIHTYIYIYVCIYIYMILCIYTHIHTNTYIMGFDFIWHLHRPFVLYSTF